MVQILLIQTLEINPKPFGKPNPTIGKNLNHLGQPNPTVGSNSDYDVVDLREIFKNKKDDPHFWYLHHKRNKQIQKEKSLKNQTTPNP